MSKADNKLELDLNIDDDKIDHLDRNGDACVDKNEAGDIGDKVDIRFQVVHIQLNAANG